MTFLDLGDNNIFGLNMKIKGKEKNVNGSCDKYYLN